MESTAVNKIKLGETTSLCAVCKQGISAEIVEIDGRVFMEKSCGEHGNQDVLIASDAAWYRDTMSYPATLVAPSLAKNDVEQGCPYDCGACTSHQQKVYLPVREPLRISDEPMILTWGRDNGPYTPQADNPWAPPRIRVEGGHVNGFYPGLLTYYSWAPQTPWLGMNENGFLTGTPTDLGTFSIYVSAETYYGDTAGKGTTFEVRPPLMFHANDPDLPDAPVAGLYNQTLSVTGGHDPSGYTWAIEGSLPQGLTLIPNGKTAQIIGVPTTPGTYDFGVKVSNDPEGYEQEVTQPTTLTVTGAGLGLPSPAVIHHQVCDLLN